MGWLQDVWSGARDTVETVAVLAGNYYVPGSSIVTSQLASKGSQEQLDSPIGVAAQLASSYAGYMNLSQPAAPITEASKQAAAEESARLAGANVAQSGTVAQTATGAAIGGAVTNTNSAAKTATELNIKTASTPLDTISGIARDINSLLSPISDTIHQVSQTVQRINDGIIRPIIDPINQIVKTSEALHRALEVDLKSGLQGLVRIPADIANALNSVDAVMQRSVRMTAQENRDTAEQVLVPALSKAGAGPLMAIHDYYRASASDFQDFLKEHGQIDLKEPETAEAYLAKANEALDWLYKQHGVFQVIAKGLILLADVIPMLDARRKPALDQIKQQIAKDTPTGELSPAVVAEAYQRGIISEEDALNEIQVQNLSVERAQTLLQLARSLLPVSQLIDIYARGLIDGEELNARLSRLGYDSKDAAHLEQLTWAVPSVQSIIEYWNRGLITEQQMLTLMRANGLTPDEAGRVLNASQRRAPLGEVIAAQDRSALITSGLVSTGGGGPAPGPVREAGRELGLAGGYTQTAWDNHWNYLGPAASVDAWFRGLVDRNQLRALLLAASLPEELHEQYIATQRPLIPFRSVSGMVEAGFMSELDALAIYQQHGYSQSDAVALLDFALGKRRTPAAAGGDDLSGLTQSVIMELYNQGAIERGAAAGLLEFVGVGSEAAVLLLQVADLKAQAAERKAEMDLIVTEAATGIISIEEAQAQLATLGLTATEQARAFNAILKTKRANNKLPSEAQLTSMYKMNLLTESEYRAQLGSLGYSAFWVDNLVALAGG